MVHIGESIEVVYMEVVVLGSNWIGIVVDKGHTVVNGEKELVSVVVRGYVERMVHMHGVGLVGSYKVIHHVLQLGMHGRMVFVQDISEGVAAKRVDQILLAPSIFDWSDLDACSYYNFHSFQ